MIELPEAAVIAGQITGTLAGKRIARAVANHTPHKFVWYTGDPAAYHGRLSGKTIDDAAGVGGIIEIHAGDHVVAVGAPIRYHAEGEKRPKKHQLLLEFEDGTAISSRAQMWGGFFCFPRGEEAGSIDYNAARICPSPLTGAFDRAYFDTLLDEATPKLSAKAFLATEQRVPGLGNGVLQDILWAARIHPKRKMGDLTGDEVRAMFEAVKQVLAEMTAQGGRDTEKDLFWQPGGYATVLSRHTVDTPCPRCGAPIEKASYLGGSIYFCRECQPLYTH
jgi:formamidopyrimidine-DNA glycosylase